jgi:hypothetical protein
MTASCEPFPDIGSAIAVEIPPAAKAQEGRTKAGLPPAVDGLWLHLQLGCELLGC